jgi:hypothetical protein
MRYLFYKLRTIHISFHSLTVMVNKNHHDMMLSKTYLRLWLAQLRFVSRPSRSRHWRYTPTINADEERQPAKNLQRPSRADPGNDFQLPHLLQPISVNRMTVS